MKNTVARNDNSGIHQYEDKKSLSLPAVSASIMICSNAIKVCSVSLLVIALTACATTDQAKNTDANTKTTSSTSTGAHVPPNLDTQIVGVVTSPLTDFNLVRADISPALVAAQKGPYQLPVDKSCEVIAAEVLALDLAIGPDLDAPVSPTNPDLLDRGASELSNAAVGALRRTVEGTIPFRSWVRKFSGAEKHSQDVATAVAAGIVRRSFLKGLGQASGCKAPAAPR